MAFWEWMNCTPTVLGVLSWVQFQVQFLNFFFDFFWTSQQTVTNRADINTNRFLPITLKLTLIFQFRSKFRRIFVISPDIFASHSHNLHRCKLVQRPSGARHPTYTNCTKFQLVQFSFRGVQLSDTTHRNMCTEYLVPRPRHRRRVGRGTKISCHKQRFQAL